MRKSYLLLTIVFVLFLCAVIGCNTSQAEYDPYIIKDLSTVQKNDFIQLKNGRLMTVYYNECEAEKPTKCRLALKSGYELSHDLLGYPLEWWAPQVEKITRYGNPNWAFLAKKYLDNQ